MMTNAFAIGVVLILLIPGSWWVSHTRLVASRNDVESGWADIDAELQRRHELIPQLVSTVQGAAAHETDLLVELTRRNDVVSRTSLTPSSANELEPPLTEAIRQVVALREQYPQLNSQQNFLDLQRQLSLIEDRIAAARRYYNTRVEKLNRRIEAFPSGMVARHHGFAKAEFFDT
jgi:LemA protein